MLERQDIDALLIGALYGELTPAEEARLNTHLDSHPADKSALAGLTTARNAVRESRFLTVQLEPPQAVSALLLQEASRRAPKVVARRGDDKQESWFARFVASFARHPAMAAAAMLVVVVGVAGTMYLRSGKSQFAEQSTATFAEGERSEKAATAPAAGAPAATIATASPELDEAKALEAKAGSSFEASLEDGYGNRDKAAKADSQVAAGGLREREESNENKKKTADAPRAAATNRTYIGVQSERGPQPKELQDQGAPSDGDDRAKGGAPATVAPGAVNQRPEPVVASPPPPPAPAPGRAPAASPRGQGAGAGGEDGLVSKDTKQELREGDETSWAREQAVKVTNAVKANNCKDAASLAVQLSNRNPAFYRDNVENDRDLKKCQAYINTEREKDADRQQKARALQKRNADEADRARRAAPTTNTNTK